MKTIIALHGNPGHPEDWDLLKQALGQDFNLLAVDAQSEEWIRLLTQDTSKKVLIGHSWGCYRILKALPKYEQYVEQVLLVAPYIRPERELPGLAKGLLKLPV